MAQGKRSSNMWDSLYDAIYRAAVDCNPYSDDVDQIDPEQFEIILGDLGFKIVEKYDDE